MTLLDSIRLACRIKTKAYDAELAQLAAAAAADLQDTAGVNVGTVRMIENVDGIITDQSTITEPLVIIAIKTYVRMHFGSPENYDELCASYRMQKGQLQSAYNKYRGERP